MEKALFLRLNKLLKIAPSARNYQTLLSIRNLATLAQDSQPYIPNIIPKRLPKNVVPGEHFVLKDLPFYAEAREADAQARQERLSHREERRQEGTLRRAPSEKYSALRQPARPLVEKKKKVAAKGIIIRSLVPSSFSTSTSESSLSRRVPGANESEPSIPTHEHLALSVGEESEVNQPVPPCSEPEDDQLAIADKLVTKELGPSSIEPTPPILIVIDEAATEGMESPCREPDHLAIVVADKPIARRPVAPHNLQAGFGKRLQGHLREAMEASCSSVHGDQLERIRRDDGFGPMSSPDTAQPGGPMHEEGGASPALGEDSGHSAPTGEDSTNEIAHISVYPLPLPSPPTTRRWRKC